MFRVCVYPSDEKGRFVAHCLELDVLGEGACVEEAMSELLEAIETQIEACEDTGAQLQFFAPPQVWKRYKAALTANRCIARELLERVVRSANERLGVPVDIFERVVGARGVPPECLATA